MQLQAAALVYAQLQGAILDAAQLQGAMLNVAQLQGASLNRAQMQGRPSLTPSFRAHRSTAHSFRARNLLTRGLITVICEKVLCGDPHGNRLCCRRRPGGFVSQSSTSRQRCGSFVSGRCRQRNDLSGTT